MMNQSNQDRMVTLLLCSDLGLNQDIKNRYKPYTTPQWNKLVDAIVHSSIQRPSGLVTVEKDIIKQELSLDDEELNRLTFLLKRGGNLAIEIEGLESKGIRIITRSEEKYPQKLKLKLKKNSPPVIYYSGNLDLVNKPGVAIVGSRDVDNDGKLFTEKLAAKCAKEALTVVSGGARGVDSIAEETAIVEGGQVISVASDNLISRIKEKKVRDGLLQDNMLIMSSVNPTARFSVYSAMDRNKYIYALSDYAVVVASKENSGGTWTGALENLKKKLSPLFVRCSNDMPSGNIKLLEQGGKPIDVWTIDSKNLTLKKWLEVNVEENINHHSYYQSNLYDLKVNIPDNAAVSEAMSNSDYSSDVLNNADEIKISDVYYNILPCIKRALAEPKNQEELSKILNVNKPQIAKWLKRAVENDEIVKLKNPLKYAVKGNLK
jgi:DNA processing protein